VFSSVSGFDSHQRKAFDTDTPITCLDPAALGMHRNQFGRWAMPDKTGRSGPQDQNLSHFQDVADHPVREPQ
jgi:hypothetical protein